MCVVIRTLYNRVVVVGSRTHGGANEHDKESGAITHYDGRVRSAVEWL